MNSNPDSLSIIPLPCQIDRRAGEFILGAQTVIVADADNQWNARYLRDLLAPATDFDLPVQADEPENAPAILLRISADCEIHGREGYTLSVSPETVVVKALQTTGVFYGIQTLRQLLPVEIERRSIVSDVTWQVPCLSIQDQPRFEWRGYMLDEGRHFHGKEAVLRALDLMALQKLNVLHWHLTEDQGWRIEIKQYPKLTEVGSKRKGTTKGLFGKPDGIPHEGFYTQDEIKEIVEYAAQRHITIVPEIEMPGHSLAALAAYPEFGCTGGPYEVRCRFGISFDLTCAGKEETFTFLQNVLDEVMELFPSPFIHIGGDEAPKRRWKNCPDCQRRIQQEDLKDEHELQVYFVNRMAVYLASRGRRMVGWNESLDEGLEEGAVVQYWFRHRDGVIDAIRGGRDVIVSSFMHAYLDRSYSLTPLSKAYLFEPVFSELDDLEAKHILGVEAPMWTEFVPSRARLDYQTYPRLTAFAETGWTPKEKKDLANFQQRLGVFLHRLGELDVDYAPEGDWEPSKARQLFGVLTIARPQTRVAPPRQS